MDILKLILEYGILGVFAGFLGWFCWILTQRAPAFIIALNNSTIAINQSTKTLANLNVTLTNFNEEHTQRMDEFEKKLQEHGALIQNESAWSRREIENLIKAIKALIDDFNHLDNKLKVLLSK